MNRPQGFVNNALFGLGILFIAPALLVVGGFVLVAAIGRPPGGTFDQCERMVSEDLAFRIGIYAYTAGLTPYEQQTFSVSSDADGTWQTIFDDVVQAPRGVTCDSNIRLIEDRRYVLWHRKNIAVFDADTQNWIVQNICDAPRPNRGRCDEDQFDFVAVDFADSQIGQATVQEWVVDEYGQPLMQNDEPLFVGEYVLFTSDGGQSWHLENSSE